MRYDLHCVESAVKLQSTNQPTWKLICKIYWNNVICNIIADAAAIVFLLITLILHAA